MLCRKVSRFSLFAVRLLSATAVATAIGSACSPEEKDSDGGIDAVFEDSDSDADETSDSDETADSDETVDGSDEGGGAGSTGEGESESVVLPTPGAGFDYQIGGGYTPALGVTIVSRDREDAPATGLYNICYVNGFQVQPNEEDFWLEEHPELILRDDEGEPVIDEDWDEMLLDTSSAEKREALLVIVGQWIDGCAQSGFDAVEIDNLDTYSRSGARLSEDNNVAFMALLSKRAHQAGLASGQKNSAEILSRAKEMGTDFAVAEECNQWNECGDYTDVYGELVYVIEYRALDFAKGCAEFPELSIVLRDLDVSPAGSPGYVYDRC